MALQLAFYEMHKYSPATYESGAIRKFKHGRTECVRVCSSQVVEFVKTWTNFHATKEDLSKSLKAALASHNEYMKAATNAKGVDRHLLGLRCMMKANEPKHPFFTNGTYSKGVNFELSTSNMSPGVYQASLGFGPVVDTGYGINYATDKYLTKFSIGSKKSCPTTNSFIFRRYLEGSIFKLVDFLDTKSVL
jgi:carnitine O-acetyltransferase